MAEAVPVTPSHKLVVREASPPPGRQPRLLDRVRQAIHVRHYSRRTEKAYVAWTRRYILFHGKRHPAEMGATELTQYLSALATQGNVAASTQNQALSALLFLYRDVLGQDVPWLDEVVRAKRTVRLPVVLTRDEVRAVIRQLRGTHRLMAILLYGAGLRLLECARLRVKDVDFSRSQIIVRAGKGDKDRATPLPAIVRADLAAHLEVVKRQHDADLRHGAGWVELPWALARKYPGAGREWFSVQQWLAIEQEGLTIGLVPVDSPLVTIGDIARGAWPTDFGQRSTSVFSYVMNNYTPEGYQAGQGGEFVFRYAISSFEKFDPVPLPYLKRRASRTHRSMMPFSLTRSSSIDWMKQACGCGCS
jgi:integron integrase